MVELPRRAFLRQLATLPLIGGAVTLIGQPTAAAEPVTDELLQNYNQWLWGEHQRCGDELGTRFGIKDARFDPHRCAGRAFHKNSDWSWNYELAPASARAALVLSAVGCDWREG